MSATPDELVLVFSRVVKTGAVRLGAIRLLPGARCVIGRADGCEVVVKSNSMSREHAAVTLREGVFLIEVQSPPNLCALPFAVARERLAIPRP